MTELVLVEGLSDVQLISHYLQNVYGWKYERENGLGISPLDKHEHIESLSKDGNQLVLCGVGGNGNFGNFVKAHRINEMIVDEDISSLMVVTDRDDVSKAKITRSINSALDNIQVKEGQWHNPVIKDHFGQDKSINTYLLIIPASERGALERVIINALKDIPEESALIQEAEQFVGYLKTNLVPELEQGNKANKATVGTYFSVRDPKNAMRAFGVFISTVDWGSSSYLNQLFLPFSCLGKEKTEENRT